MKSGMAEFRAICPHTGKDTGRFAFDVSLVTRIKEEGTKRTRVIIGVSAYLLDASYDDVRAAIYKVEHAETEDATEVAPVRAEEIPT